MKTPRTWLTWITIVLWLCVLISCSKSEPDKATTEQKPETVSQPKTEPSAQSEGEVEQLPVSEDFEEEAESSINQANYRTELDRLAEEIDRDPNT